MVVVVGMAEYVLCLRLDQEEVGVESLEKETNDFWVGVC